MSNFDKLLNKCLDLQEIWANHETEGGYKLGHYDEAAREIMLYNVSTDAQNLRTLRAELDSTGVGYSLELRSEHKEVCNVLLTVPTRQTPGSAE